MRRYLTILMLLTGCSTSDGDVSLGPPLDMASPPDSGGADLGPAPVLFQPFTLAVGLAPRALALGDLDDDAARLPELIVAEGAPESPEGAVRVLRNQRGQFPAADVYPVDRAPAAIAIGDVGGDGRPDLVVSCAGASTVRVLRNQGAGVFPMDRGQRFDVAVGPGALVLGALDSVAGLDLAVLHRDGGIVSVLLGQDAGFQAPQPYRAGHFPYGLAALGPTGKQDLFITSAGDDVVIALRNRGNGTFETGRSLPVGAVPVALFGGDLSDDGQPDLAVASYGDDSVSVLLRSGDVYSTTRYAVGARPVAIAAGDVDGDRRVDLVVANQDGDDLTLLVGLGRGTFLPTRVFQPVGQRPVALTVGDVDGDDRADLVVASGQDGRLTLLRSVR